MAVCRRRTLRRVVRMEREKKVAPARKRVSWRRERGEKMEGS